MKRKTRHNGRYAAVEIGHTHLRAAVLDGPPGAAATVHVREYRWRNEAVSLNTDAGRDELEAALRTANAELGLGSAEIYLCIGGDFCVTRVVAGTEEKVKAEIAGLEKRSRLYLSLGQGPKALSGSVQQVDARHQHALLTVVNHRTLDTLLAVARTIGLKIACIEPSLVSLSRLLGRTERDAAGPSLIVNIGERGLEVGISHRGQLLLDYRPAAREGTTAAAEIVMRHLIRLQRYCDRYVKLSNGTLTNVFLSDDTDDARQARRVFEQGDGLTVETLCDIARAGDWTVEAADGIAAAAAVGALLKADPAAAEHETPNLSEGIETKSRRSLTNDIIRCCWPLAAAVLVAVLGTWLTSGIQAETAATRAKIDELGGRRAITNVTKLQVKREIERLAYDAKMRQFHTGLPADTVIEAIAQCQPDDIWLDSLTLTGVESVAITGSGFSEEGVYEFMQTLRACPRFADVALSRTSAGRDQNGPVTRFDIQLELAEMELDASQPETEAADVETRVARLPSERTPPPAEPSPATATDTPTGDPDPART
jgi:Tfp pilus assembly protein PilN